MNWGLYFCLLHYLKFLIFLSASCYFILYHTVTNIAWHGTLKTRVKILKFLYMVWTRFKKFPLLVPCSLSHSKAIKVALDSNKGSLAGTQHISTISVYHFPVGAASLQEFAVSHFPQCFGSKVWWLCSVSSLKLTIFMATY